MNMKKKFTAEGGIEVTDEILEEWAAPWERGEVPGVAAGFVAAPGRPRLSGEATQIVALRLPVSIVRALDIKAQRHGETRSQRIREAVLTDLMEA
jgi:hypothetical protein